MFCEHTNSLFQQCPRVSSAFVPQVVRAPLPFSNFETTLPKLNIL